VLNTVSRNKEEDHGSEACAGWRFVPLPEQLSDAQDTNSYASAARGWRIIIFDRTIPAEAFKAALCPDSGADI
jgi:hypothetical protein